MSKDSECMANFKEECFRFMKQLIFWCFPLFSLSLVMSDNTVITDALCSLQTFFNEQLISLVFILLTVSFASTINIFFRSAQLVASGRLSESRVNRLVKILDEAEAKLRWIIFFAVSIPIVSFFDNFLNTTLCNSLSSTAIILTLFFWFLWKLVDSSFAQLTVARADIIIHSQQGNSIP